MTTRAKPCSKTFANTLPALAAQGDTVLTAWKGLSLDNRCFVHIVHSAICKNKDRVYRDVVTDAITAVLVQSAAHTSVWDLVSTKLHICVSKG